MSGSPRPARPPALSPAPRAPPPFLRRPSSVSSSSFLSTTTSSLSEPSSDEDSTDSDSSDDNARTESYWSSSGLSGDEGRFVARLDLSLRAPTSNGGVSSSIASTASSFALSLGPGQAGTASPIARSNLRLSLAVLRARQSLASHSFDALASSLKSLSAALPALSTLSRAPSTAAENPLGVFVPTLARLASDVRAALRDEGDKGREFRRTKLARDDAKALVGLRQRWSSGAAGGKGKARETDSLEWVPLVEAAVATVRPSLSSLRRALADVLPAQNPPPDLLAATAANERFDRLTPALLTSLEAFLLPSSLPRLSLSDLGLTDADLVVWPALRWLEQVTAWYFSFVVADPDEARRRARIALDGVKSLDLSKNKLTSESSHFSARRPAGARLGELHDPEQLLTTTSRPQLSLSTSLAFFLASRPSPSRTTSSHTSRPGSPSSRRCAASARTATASSARARRSSRSHDPASPRGCARTRGTPARGPTCEMRCRRSERRCSRRLSRRCFL